MIKLKQEKDVELIIEAHSNNFLKVQVRLLEDEEVVNNYDIWLSFCKENSRVYSEIIQVDTNLAFILYYESFSPGKGMNSKINSSKNEDKILVQQNNQTSTFPSMSKSDLIDKIDLKHWGFRVQLRKMMYRKKCTNLIDVMIIDKSTLTDDNKLIDEVWKDFLEDYKHMQTLTEDTRKSSLFSQMINKTNMVLSDEEEEEYQSNYIDPPIKNPNDVEKERLISLNKVQSKLNLFIF